MEYGPTLPRMPAQTFWRDAISKTARSLLAALAFGVLVGLVFLAPQPAIAESLGSPGPDHERLNQLIGEWTTFIKHWKTAEDEPTTLRGTARCQWVLGGRFVEEHAENETSNGGRFQSVTYLGYDRQTKLYDRFWLTNTWTGMFIERGRYDPDTNVIQTQGSEIDPSGAVILTTSELKIDSPNRHVFTSYTIGTDGVRWKQLEILYSKK